MQHIKDLLIKCGIKLESISESTLINFSENSDVKEAIETIANTNSKIMEKWRVYEKISDFKNASISIPNGTQNAQYKYQFQQGFMDAFELSHFAIVGLENVGLHFDEPSMCLSGVPQKGGDFDFDFIFKILGDDANEQNRKTLKLVVNPDPKLLWKNLPSDKDAIYWKKDNESAFGEFSDRSIVISSKRGRSHQNVGSFRDDHFSFKNLTETGWSIAIVSDGAGSAPFSREGSKLACEHFIEDFGNRMAGEEAKVLMNKFTEFASTKDESISGDIEEFCKQTLYKAAVNVYMKLEQFARGAKNKHKDSFENYKAENPIELFHSTLCVVALKKIEMGYCILSFSVGDCPIGMLDKTRRQAKLLNWLDVGEFGGGTRFITQNQIFHSKERPFASRLTFDIIPSFSHIFLMTDGIYDPKFEVEANLDQPNKWYEFLADLQGANEEDVKIDFSRDNKQLENELNDWMDFWSRGNHDDRTLAIIF